MTNVTLHHVGSVSSESGPLLLVDVMNLADWSGTARGDYERICHWLDDNPGTPGYGAEVGMEHGLVWDLGGPGTADVFRRSRQDLLICRAWEDDEDRLSRAAASPAVEAERFGAVSVRSGWLLAFWPTAAGTEIVLPADRVDGHQVEVDGVGDAGLLVTLEPGEYFAWWDKANHSSLPMRRCWILKDDELPA